MSENAVPDWARISRSFNSACDVKPSFSTNICSTRALNVLASGKFANITTAVIKRMSTTEAIPPITNLLPVARVSEAEIEFTCTVPSLFESGFVKNIHDVQ